MKSRRFRCSFVIVFVSLVSLAFAEPDGTRVFQADERPRDSRLQALKDLNGYFPFAVPDSVEAWNRRAAAVRRRVLVSTGLWPMPERGPVQATMHGRVDRGEYTVEKVYFESYPGFFVTGSLYRPKGKPGPFPAVLSPHGHFSNGRFYDQGVEGVRQQIFIGAERFEKGGRYPLQARCVQLARMGCVVFHYDMVGYADSTQISFEVAHRHAKPRSDMESSKGWGLYTAQAEMRLQNVMGLQTFNSLRAVDFLVGLDDVDSQRLAVTGASGGGTQTMILAALDPRIAVSFPAVMVSTAMQGGCTCENATCLRVGTGNVEFAALFAPKPQGLNGADDWTVELATKGLPELRQLYAKLNAKDHIAGYPLTQFKHNYNAVSRGKMYHWMNRFLKLGIEEPVLERDYDPLTISEMSVWNDEHPRPAGGVEFEKQLLRTLSDASDKQLQSLARQSKEKHQALVRSALRTILATNLEAVGIVERENLSKLDLGDYFLFKDQVRTESTELPVVFLHPKDWNGKVVVWVTGSGKAHLFGANHQLRDRGKQLLDDGFSIVAPDLFQQGEFLASHERLEETRRVGNTRDFAGYTFGYNRTLLGHQVHDILTILKFAKDDDHQPKEVHLLGTDGAAPQAILAAALADDHLDKLVVDSDDFRFARVTSWRDPYFLPGAVKYGDLPMMLQLCPAEVEVLPRND